MSNVVILGINKVNHENQHQGKKINDLSNKDDNVKGNKNGSEHQRNDNLKHIRYLDVRDVHYIIQERLGSWWQGLCFRKKQEKVILNRINLRVCSGEVTAILGNSGSGKTTILNVIANRAGNGEIKGSVEYCGKPLTSNVFKKRAGYVIQADRHMANLTVRETLYYIAHLKYTKDNEKVDVKERVELAITQMGMRHLKNSIVGGLVERGLSGGEKRRLSIASQLIQDPAILLLDEPTTGLDSFTAHSIINTLSKLAREYNKIVLLSIHQPRSDIFSLFDKIALLSQGEMVYYGPRSKLVSYFSEAGYPCPTYANPLDHYVDVSSIDRRNEQDEEQTIQRACYLKDYYRKSLIYQDMISDMESNNVPSDISLKNTSKSGPCTYFRQSWILLKRLNVNLWRSNISILGRLTQLVFFGFIIWIFLFELTHDYTGIQDRTGLFFETTSATPIMGLLNAIAMFTPLRDLYYRESADGLYKGAPFLTAYYIHIFPFHVISSAIYSTWIYWGVGCYPDVGRFFIFFAVVTLLQYLGELFAVLFLCIFDSVALAQSSNMLFFTINVTVASGFLRASSSLLEPLKWLQYISFNKYASEIVIANEYHDLEFECPEEPDGECSFSGDDYLAVFFPKALANMTVNFIVLTSFVVGMWIINIIAFKLKGIKHLN